MNNRLRQNVVLLTAIAQVAINVVIGSGAIDVGLPLTSDISDSLPSYFTPAGYTFLIWNVIFVGVIAYAIYQFRPGQAERLVHQRIGWWSAAANVGNGLWSIVWGLGGVKGTETFQPIFHLLSGLIMIGILFALTVIFIHLRDLHSTFIPRDEWLIQASHAAFFAWINVAALANMTAILVAYNVQPGAAGALWSILMIVIATGLACGLILYNRGMIATAAFTFIIAWALVGVAVGNAAESGMVGVVAMLGVVVVIAVTIFRFSTGQNQRVTSGAGIAP